MSNWQPIETAPKDGTVIRLKSEKHEPDQPFFWKGDRWTTRIFAMAASYDAWWDEDAEQPSYWQPA